MGISFGGAGGVTSAGTGYKSSDLVYERVASTLAAPVPAGASDYVLINWTVPNTRKGILLTSVGTDQHDNTRYTWVVDGVILPISGSARAGSILQPYVFGSPIRVVSSIVLRITNNNAVAYPNPGNHPSDSVPYEGVFSGWWL